ncbi:hypothetical protein [Legionella yabuuchiae]|uniref:hypothetical protein n=1 Tax=Legionella yabuuchiae TaxID=376727 RepID=UPI00105610F2|nr:hypothetical protein [Legionella yabuuchiae]
MGSYQQALISASYDASIPPYKLLNDIKQYYHDPKIIAMLENIITNLIDTPRGSRNPSHGIALRAPLSQFFSALYLKRSWSELNKSHPSIFLLKRIAISVRIWPVSVI